MFADFAAIEPGLPLILDERWYARNAASAEDHFESVTQRFDDILKTQTASGRALPVRDERLFGRASAYTQYVENSYSWSSLAAFGDAGTKGALLLDNILSPLRRTIQDRLRR